MQLSLNDKVYEMPPSLSQIKLKQHIAFIKKYGADIDKQEVILLAMPDGDEKNIELTLHNLDVACKTIAFYAGIALEDVQKTNINHVLNIYQSCFKQLFEQQDNLELQEKYLWNDEIWNLEQPKISYQTKISFNQFVTSKQIVKSLADLSKGIWEAMPILATIFLQKEGEGFKEAMIAEGSERVQLMNELPMDIALSVAFFLQSSMSLYMISLVFSEQVGQKALT